MNLYGDRGFLQLTRKWPEGVAVATSRNIDAVIQKKAPVSVQTNESVFP